MERKWFCRHWKDLRFTRHTVGKSPYGRGRVMLSVRTPGKEACGGGMEWGTEAEAERQTRTVWLSRRDTTNVRRELVRTDQSWETSEGGLDNTSQTGA